MSNIYANNINPRSGSTVTFPQNIKVLGTATYEDVANVDSVGIVTAQSGIVIDTKDTSVNSLSIGSKGGGANDGHLEGEGPKINFLATRSNDGVSGSAAYIQQKAIGDLSSSYPVDLAFGVRRFGSPIEAMRIVSTGSVGIGTDNPDRKLVISQANSTAYSGTDFDQNYHVLKLNNTTDSKTVGMQFLIGSNGEAAITATEASDGATDLIFGTRGGGSRAERLRITSGGDLFVAGTGGMNTSQLPNGNLVNINGTDSNDGFSIIRYSGGYGAYGLNIGRSSSGTVGTNAIVSNNNDIGHITFYGADGSSYLKAAQITANVDGTPSAGSAMPGRLVFKTSPDGSATPVERLRINENGRVDVGDELGVAHAGEFQVINTGGGQQDNDCLAFFETNGNDWCIKTNFNTSGSHYHAHFLQEGGTKATIAGSSGQNAVFTSGSDHRLKENVVDLTDAEGIDLVKNLKPRKYNWISNRTNTGEINTVNGFIAHEVEEAGVGHLVYGNGKDAVKKDGSIDTQTLDYAGMTPVLAAAIKGLISKVEDLEQRLINAGL